MWFIWGAVYTLAGVLTINFVNRGNIAQGFGGIADAVEPSSFELAYPDAVGAILSQHGFNLLWFGVIMLICSILIWRKSGNAIFLAPIVGGLADLGGHVNFVSGTVMLTPRASAGLVLTMVGAIILHVQRNYGAQSIIINVVLLAVAAFVAYGRFI
ncbi:MAG: DoxX family protein [Deinococcota bacterium]